MYQFVFINLDTNLPFTLHTMLPQHEIMFSHFTASDQLSERQLQGRVVMVQEDKDGNMDPDIFLSLLDEVLLSARHTAIISLAIIGAEISR